MFYKMITNKCKQWLQSEGCTIKELLSYISKTNKLRDAQIEAIKVYLFLKIACGNKPLAELFCDGYFNTLKLEDLDLKTSVRDFLSEHKDAAALFEFASLKDDEGNLVSIKIIAAIKKNPAQLDYQKIFRDFFYGVSYTDYLFSLPMGAGKTYLMAIFMYLDLYFASMEPDNKAFAHNFMIFAPSGLKSSVIPSLKTIKNFDPTWVIPEPAASNLKRLLTFEVLDQVKTQKKSNKIKNPNVQKIANHQPLQELFGFIAVTNAEKVILDRIVTDKGGNVSLYEDNADEKDRLANELRNLIGKIPNLSVFIDEVHHVVAEDNKLRQVVTKWTEGRTFNSVIGFSGTPYLSTKEKFMINDKLSVATIEISNIVYYYPLVDGIGNFLKLPVVKIATKETGEQVESERITEAGLRLFLDKYKDKVYPDGTIAKIGVYCGTIEKLEERIYPLAARIVTEYGLNPDEVILKFHKGNKHYSASEEAQLQFDTLDKAISKIRIVLLVQIGKEGWDCRSLTGIILSQEGDCPNNMVLQTSCRCLRQVEKGAPETALIYLNGSNAEILNTQLKKQHHISLDEFQKGNQGKIVTLNRYDRTEHLHLPTLDYYQLEVNYESVIEDKDPHTAKRILAAITKDALESDVVVQTQTSFDGSGVNENVQSAGNMIVRDFGNPFIKPGAITTFNQWLNTIIKESFATLRVQDLQPFAKELHQIYAKITINKDGITRFNPKFKLTVINSNIRKAFYIKRDFKTRDEVVPEHANLLLVQNFTTELNVAEETLPDYIPDQTSVEKIIAADKGKLTLDAAKKKIIEALEKAGETVTADSLRKKYIAEPMREKTYHYLPYHTGSPLEQDYFRDLLTMSCIKDLGLEIYYNGDRYLSGFKISCYKGHPGRWQYIGQYTPDFLILQRDRDKIHKAIIVETKGSGYANDPQFIERRKFVENFFAPKNNKEYGYNRFEYLYIEESLSQNERISKTTKAVTEFFKEDK